MRGIVALARFEVAGYVRSLRVLHAITAEALLIGLVLLAEPPSGPQEVLNTLADSAALMFPIWAWAGRGLLDTEPDTQRYLSAVSIGRRGRAVAAGLLAA